MMLTGWVVMMIIALLGGYCIFLGKNLICWSYCKQKTIARSSIEDEDKALTNIDTELSWLIFLCSEIGLQFS